MATQILAANNAQSVLAAGISSSATSLTVNTGTGALFPSPVSGTSFFKLTLIDAATGNLTEIMHVTARSGDVMTVDRAQEGTVARSWSANDIVANMLTAGTLQLYAQKSQALLTENNLSEISSSGSEAMNQARKNLGLADSSGYVGRLVRPPTVITSSSTHTLSTSTKLMIVEVLGGGGGGGGAQAGTGFASFGGGGGAGSYAKGKFTTLSPSYSVVIGSGGTGGGGTSNGTSGSTTSFGSIISASGGNPGPTVVADTVPYIIGSFGAAGSVTGGNIVSVPCKNTGGLGFRLNATTCSGGYGADSIYGRGGDPAASINRAGNNGSGYGAGGAGGRAVNQTGIPYSGGNGSNGVVIVWEYA